MTKAERSAALPNRAARRAAEKDWFSLDELAEYLGLSRHGVSNMLARGEIPGAMRFGNRWRISRPAFERAFHGDPSATDAA